MYAGERIKLWQDVNIYYGVLDSFGLVAGILFAQPDDSSMLENEFEVSLKRLQFLWLSV